MIRYNWVEKLYSVLANLLMIVLCIIFVVPLILVVSISLDNIDEIYKFGYSFLPHKLTFDSYRFLFLKTNTVLNAYKITIFITALGTTMGVIFTSMTAYAISIKAFRYRKMISYFIIFTMMFSGGMVASYIFMTKYYNLGNTIWVLILPGMVNAWNIILMRTFFMSIPDTIFEAATIDGASEYRIYLTIATPLAKPAYATIALFLSLAYWNDWFKAMLYISNEKLIPLQYLLVRMLKNIEELQKAEHVMDSAQTFPSETIRMAMAVVAAGPMLFVFPFFQKYFVKGLTVGGVKG